MRSKRSASHERKLYDLLHRALQQAGSQANPDQLLDAMFDDYREFKRGKKREEWARLPRGH